MQHGLPNKSRIHGFEAGYVFGSLITPKTINVSIFGNGSKVEKIFFFDTECSIGEGRVAVTESVYFSIIVWAMRTLNCVVNSHQTLTGHNLSCYFLCVLHEEFHGLASSA